MIITLQSRGNHPSYILHEKAQHYFWQGTQSLSIKTFFSGRALYTFGKGYYAVDDTAYLIVNQDQEYAIHIDANSAVESFCLFFEPGFVEAIYHSLTTPLTRLLDNPEWQESTTLHFFERTYSHDTLLSPLLFSLRARVMHETPEQNWLVERFYELAQCLLQLHANVYREVEMLPALRPATREELYRRLHRAREYINACFDTSVTLNDLSQVASLSPNHLLRTFKHLFHQTPHQYLLQKRLERAQHLLTVTDTSITEICFVVGFESLSSFSGLFRQRVGCSPTYYRSQKGDF